MINNSSKVGVSLLLAFLWMTGCTDRISVADLGFLKGDFMIDLLPEYCHL